MTPFSFFSELSYRNICLDLHGPNCICLDTNFGPLSFFFLNCNVIHSCCLPHTKSCLHLYIFFCSIILSPSPADQTKPVNIFLHFFSPHVFHRAGSRYSHRPLSHDKSIQRWQSRKAQRKRHRSCII